MGRKAAHQGVSQLSDAVPGLPGLSASWRVIARNGLASHPPTLVLLDDDGQTVGARSLRRGELVLECCQNAAQQSSPALTLPSASVSPSLPTADNTASRNVNPGSKQSLVITMLQSPQGDQDRPVEQALMRPPVAAIPLAHRARAPRTTSSAG
jgi:hypothetical protein